MVKLAKYLKPFAGWIAAAMLLLLGQSFCELYLPNFLSDIVDVGIQRGGVEDAAPQAISEQGLEMMTLMMTEEEKSLAEACYVLPQSGLFSQKELSQAEKAYPKLQNSRGYLLKADEEDREALENAFGKASWTLIYLTRSAMPQDIPENSDGGEDSGSIPAIDVARIYDALPVLRQLPDEAIEQARRQAEETGESLRQQTGTVFCRAFYQELGADIFGIQTRYILLAGLQMLLVSLGGGLATVLVSLFSSRIAAGLARDLRRDVFHKVESFSQREFDHFSTASLITRTTNDVTQVQMLIIMGIRMMVYAPIMGIGGTVMALGKSTSMAWIIVLAVVILLCIVFLVFSIATPKFKLVQRLVDKLNLVSRENLSGMMVIRAFGTQKFEEQRFDKANRDLTRTHLFVNRVMTFMMPTMMLIMNLSSLLVVWVGAHQIAESTMQVGDMMAFMQYLMQIIGAFLSIAMMFIMVPRAAASGERIAEVLEEQPSIVDPEQPRRLDHVRGEITFDKVSFQYDGAQEPVLKEISFTAKAGQTTAFIGSTGSGKSTLVNLIPRFYDVTGGRILLDGVDIREISQKTLRGQIGYVPQKGNLFTGTIASNLAYARPDATQEEFEQAVETAQAAQFVDALPERYDSPISQGGTNVSGGQKQRLSIARALVKKPPVYILDDSFSALDFKTDAALRHALKEYTGGATVLIVAQRISTIMTADQIVVLDEGAVVGRGTHQELLKTCETYREIAHSQLSKEELQ